MLKILLPIAVKVIAQIFNSLIGLLIARQIGPEAFGIYSLYLAVLVSVTIISEFGITGNLIAHFSLDKHQIKSVVSASINLLWISNLIAQIAALIILNFLTENTLPKYASIFIAISLIPSIYIYQKSKIDSSEKRYLLSNIESISTLIFTILKLTIISYANTEFLFYLLLIHTIQIYFLAASRFYLFIKHNMSSQKSNVSAKTKINTKQLFKESYPLFISTLILGINLKIDLFTIQAYCSDIMLGNYAILLSLYGMLVLPSQLYSNFIYPDLVNNTDTNLWAKHHLLILYYFLISLILMLITIKPVYYFLGDEYFFQLTPAILLFLSFLFHSWSFLSSKKIIIDKIYSFSYKRMIVALIINLSGNLFLVPKIGVEGAAASTFISFLWLGLISDLTTKKLRGLAIIKINSLKLQS